MPRSSGAWRRVSRWKCSTAVPSGQRKTSAWPWLTRGVTPETTSTTRLSPTGTLTVWASERLAFTNTQTRSSVPVRQNPKTSSPDEKGSNSPSTSRSGSILRTAIALR